MDATINSNSTNHTMNSIDIANQRTNIYIIFVEFSTAQTSKIISFLRDHHFAPRGKNINTPEEISEALAERSWDLIICKEQQTAFDPLAMANQLALLEKDIPCIQLIKEPSLKEIAHGLLNNIQAVLPSDDEQLLLLHIQREYQHLESRRQVRLIHLQLSESQKRCKLLMNNSSLAIGLIHNQKIIYANDAFCEMFGYKIEDQLLHKSILSLIATQEHVGMSQLLSKFIDSNQSKQPYQLLAKRVDKSNFTAHIELQQTLYNDKECVEITIKSHKDQNQESKFAELDAITGLYNLEYFNNALENNLKLAQRGGNDCQLIYIDILNLLSIRSQYGNDASRTLARDVADILNDEFSRNHLKARLSDNIFAIIYSDPSTQKIKDIAEHLNSRINHHVSVHEEEEITIENAIAIVPITDTISNVQQAFDRANEAITQTQNIANHQPKVVIFNANSIIDNTQQTTAQAEEAITNNKLRLLYQPLVPLVFDSEQQHYEVLLRMIGEDNENILPAKFMTSIKHANLNESMDRWVIEQSINQFRHALDNNKQLKIFISVTDTVWEHEGLLLWMADKLRQSRISADHIVIQISESESANSLSKAKFFVAGLRRLDCLVCLKHYGSTNDSQAILKTLDPDYIKFDGSFIQELSDGVILDSTFQALLNNLTNVGKITIAPQVETPKVMSMLWKSGVGMVQGYYLQPPEEEMDYEF